MLRKSKVSAPTINRAPGARWLTKASRSRVAAATIISPRAYRTAYAVPGATCGLWGKRQAFNASVAASANLEKPRICPRGVVMRGPRRHLRLPIAGPRPAQRVCGAGVREALADEF